MRWFHAAAIAVVLLATQSIGRTHAACTCHCVDGSARSWPEEGRWSVSRADQMHAVREGFE